MPCIWWVYVGTPGSIHDGVDCLSIAYVNGHEHLHVDVGTRRESANTIINGTQHYYTVECVSKWTCTYACLFLHPYMKQASYINGLAVQFI